MVMKMIRKKESKEIIKREKQKIKEAKKKIKREKQERFYNTKLGKVIRKMFLVKRNNNQEPITIKEQIVSMIYFEILGFIICLLVFFILSGGKNYIRDYIELKKLINVYDAVTTSYYGKIDKQAMIDNAIESMMEEVGDDYTIYTDKKETTNFLENVDGVYEGIGCTVATNDNGEIYVVSLFNDSPASAAGIQEKDIILKIDDKDFKEKTSEDMANYIKNSKNNKIKLTIKRGEEEKEITINRKKVKIPTVQGKIINRDNKKLGYIQISIFSSQTYEQFRKELETLEKDKIEGLIIDVRSNTGGYLTSETDITSMFLKKGDIIYQLENGKKTEKIKDKTKESREYPVAVLINVASASASEILASAIKESYKGLIIGTNSYGKGTVQKTKKLSDGTMIKYTIQKWLTPKGNWINEVGVTPTTFVELKSSTAKDEDPNIDKQLETAINELIEKLKS